MKRLVMICAFAMALPFFGTYAFSQELGPARLSLVDGDVQVLIQDTTDWTPASVNLPMNEHDRLWVPDGARAELQLQGGVYAREDGNTSLDILTLSRDSAQFYMEQGHLYVDNRRGGINTVQIDTPAVSLRSYDNSIMMLDVGQDGVNEISVLKGIVYAESRAGATRVSAGNTLTISGDSGAQVAPIGPPDDWEQWNVNRDQEVSAWSESSRYLPDELHEYASDFDQNGRWDYVSDYGYVWFPAAVDPGWAPYTYGSWLWIRGNYVWVDYSTWGWAPTHYGRWVSIGSRGWCWVPPAAGSVYWAPGYVGWVVTSSYVAWVPLAPGEVYYGYGYYGPGSVNITTVNINAVTVNRNYRNARAANSVVVVRRDTFGTGRRVPMRVEGNPFERRDRTVNVVPPRVRPDRPIVVTPPEAVREHTREVIRERESRQPLGPRRVVPGETRPEIRHEPDRATRMQPTPPGAAVRPPAAQLPPEQVRRNRPEALKNERPIIRQREASVFKPHAPENLPVTRSREPRVINRPADRQAPPSRRQAQPGR